MAASYQHHSALSKIVTGIDEADARERCEVEERDNKQSSPSSCSSSVTPSSRKVISWNHEDHENPYNWSTVRHLSYCVLPTDIW
jgi:hypothetical protein